MEFPIADNKSYVHIKHNGSEKFISLLTVDWEKINTLPELDYDNSGLHSKNCIYGFQTGSTQIYHKNEQTQEYWEQLKSWIEYQLNKDNT